MTRTPRLTLALAFFVIASVLAPAPVAGQIDVNEIGQLERRRDELTVLIAELDIAVGELNDRVDALDDALRDAETGLELLADEFERVVDSRREPANTRIEFAIVTYINGDPRRNALLDELEAIQGSTEPTRRRQFYDAVIEAAVSRLEAIDEQLRDLADEVDRARSEGDAIVQQRSDTAAEREALGGQRTALALELDEVVARIQILHSLENRALLTGLPTFNDMSRPALAVKIDNVGPALPQAGINQADIVWEEEVEGGLTRLAAIFHSEAPSVVGPVRSMRTSDVDLLAQLNNPLFANSGGNRVTTRIVAESSLVNIGAAQFLDAYYRDTSRARPANLFANTLNLWAVGADEGAGRPFPLWAFREEGADPPIGSAPATGVSVVFTNTTVDYAWNGSGWARTQNGAAHVDTAGARVAPANVIIQFTDYGTSPADPASPEAITVGTNPAWILIDGTVVQGFWRRDEVTDAAEFVDGDGRPIALDPGRTWITLARRDSATLR